jgi:hypothetical protein
VVLLSGGDAHAAPAGLIHSAKCFVVVVVEVGEIAQLRGRMIRVIIGMDPHQRSADQGR